MIPVRLRHCYRRPTGSFGVGNWWGIDGEDFLYSSQNPATNSVSAPMCHEHGRLYLSGDSQKTCRSTTEMYKKKFFENLGIALTFDSLNGFSSFDPKNEALGLLSRFLTFKTKLYFEIKIFSSKNHHLSSQHQDF